MSYPVVPALRENVVPDWVSEAPRPYSTKSAHGAMEFMRYLAERGVTLDWRTGEMFDLGIFVEERVERLEASLRETQRQLAALQVDISMQRAEAILSLP